jgi:cell wall-associated NlpC family hydrolase
LATPRSTHPSRHRAPARHRAPRRHHRGRWVATLLTAGSLAAGIAVTAGGGTAAASPTIQQVQAKVAAINVRAEKITEAYDAARGQLQQLKGQATAAHRTLVRDQALLAGMQHQLTSMVTAAYESAGLSGATEMLGSGNPELVMDQASDLGLVASSRQAALAKAFAASREVEAAQATYDSKVAAERATLAGIVSKRQQIQQLLVQAQAQLATLKAAQQRRLAQQAAREHAAELAARRAAEAAAPTAASPAYGGPASGAAAVAVRFAYAQLGKPYVYGGAGPDSYDCSGLTMRAWGAAGVALAHNAAEQQASVSAVSLSALEPGDLVFFGAPAYHVAIYVGNGNIIQAPHTGADVELTPLSYMPAPSGAGRP